MTRRFRVSAALDGAGSFCSRWATSLPGHPVERLVPPCGVELGPAASLATPVVVWGGWPFFVRGWQSIVNRSLNMFTLIALGVGVAYVYSVVGDAVSGRLSRRRSG